MTKYTNKLPLFEQRYTLTTRTVTVEDAENDLFTDSAVLPNNGIIYERIMTAMMEIYSHVKKNADITLTAGTFYFKGEDTESPTLLFATNLKTDRPILVLNPNVYVALILHEASTRRRREV